MTKKYIANNGWTVRFKGQEYLPPAEDRPAKTIPMTDAEAAPYLKDGIIVAHSDKVIADEPVAEAPDAPEADAPEAAPEKSLKRMNRAELVGIALGHGIEVEEDATKAQIIELIEAAA